MNLKANTPKSSLEPGLPGQVARRSATLQLVFAMVHAVCSELATRSAWPGAKLLVEFARLLVETAVSD